MRIKIMRQPKFFFIAYFILNVIILLSLKHSCNLTDYLIVEDIPNDLVRNTNVSMNKNSLLMCPVLPEHHLSLPIPGIYSRVTEEELKNLTLRLNIKNGGHWSPSDCFPQFKVAIIVPYRDRQDQLNSFLLYMHQFLSHQKLNYTIYVVEQSSRKAFNRGKLLNIGFKEAKQLGDHSCFIFQDVDLLPEIVSNVYACSHQPRHMVVALNTFRYNLPYCDLFGGAVAFTTNQFELVNGYANRFFGWGGEDDDLSERVMRVGFHIRRWDPKVSRYFMLPHKKELPNEHRFSLLRDSEKYLQSDGLTVLQYKRLKLVKHALYTWILVQV